MDFFGWVSCKSKKIILKSANAKPSDQTEKQWDFPLTKVDVEKRIVYGLVAVPNEVDTDGDMYTPAAVEKLWKTLWLAVIRSILTGNMIIINVIASSEKAGLSKKMIRCLRKSAPGCWYQSHV